MRNAFTLPSKTYIELDQPETYKRFMQGYFQLFRENLQSYKAMDQKWGFEGDPLYMRSGNILLETRTAGHFSILSNIVANGDTTTWRRRMLSRKELAGG